MRSCLHLPYYIGKHCIFTRSCLSVPFNFGEHCIFEKLTSFTILFWEALYIFENLTSLLTILFWGALYISEKNKISLTWIMLPLHFMKCPFSCFLTATHCKYYQPVRVPEQVCCTKLNQYH